MIQSFLSEFIYGSMDGIITTIAIISGVLGTDISYNYAFIFGVSNVLADGFSMGIARYNSLTDVNHINTKINAFYSALATFFSFIIVGSIPLIPFLLYNEQNTTKNEMINILIYFSLFLFFTIGLIKGIYVKKIYKSVIQTILIGTIGAYISYKVASILN